MTKDILKEWEKEFDEKFGDISIENKKFCGVVYSTKDGRTGATCANFKQ